MIVSIGMLAWNEEAGIAATIRSLFQQTAFVEKGGLVDTWELLVVPNGCSDATAKVAEAAVTDCISALGLRNVSFTVVELEQAGKSNAWNHYVHQLSRKDADFILMVDSDIEFDHPDTVSNAVRTLHGDSLAQVVVDLPLKDIVRKKRKSLLERLSVGVSKDRLSSTIGIAGSFYCARAAVLRGIWMPVGLPGEDGFLKAMIVTDLFRSDIDTRRLVRAQNASHFYEAESTISGIFKHELRLVIGTALNCYFTWDFLKFATDPQGPGAGVLIRNCLERDPNWYRDFIMNEIRNRGFWVLPRDMLFRRFSSLNGVPTNKYSTKLILAVCAFLFDLCVFIAANRRLKQGRGIGFW
jgi:glycosyltransferase involved in cell wall biosynthesis